MPSLLPVLLLSLVFSLLVSCTSQVTPAQALETAERYRQLPWTPRAENILHGEDANGILVHTPDSTLAAYGDSHGWWEPGVPTRGMPYKWGGFDTPESFLQGIRKGRAAGDIATVPKVRQGLDGVSRHTVGIDCSGLISRCWNLKRQYSTRELPDICTPLAHWDELRAGDILLTKGHVLLFVRWEDQQRTAVVYESGPIPYWNVHVSRPSVARLKETGYRPWRYHAMEQPEDG